MTALTCTDTAPSGSHARSRRGRVVGLVSYKPGSGADLAGSAPDPLTTTQESPVSQPTHPEAPDAVLPSWWLSDRRVQRLSDAGFRWAVTALMYSVANRTDGVLDQADLDGLACRNDRQAVTAELIQWGLFVIQEDGSYRLCGFGKQPTGESEAVRLRKREGNRDRQARRRKRINESVFKRDGHRCVQCGSPDDLTVDHIYPWIRGGKTEPANLQTLCRRCNSAKRDRVMPMVRDAEARQGQARTGELPPPTTNGLGQCRTCDHREPLGPDGRCENCTEWRVGA